MIQPPMRARNHPLLPPASERQRFTIQVDGQPVEAFEGEVILASVLAAGVRVCRTSARRHEPRGLYCGMGRCTDCMMVVNGQPNTLTCITPVAEGMVVERQEGLS